LWEVTALVVVVMVFQRSIEASRAAERIAQEFQALQAGLIVLVMALPFVAGIVTGIAIGFAGITFPILVGLIEATGQGHLLVPYIVLAYAFGHTGQMLSPIHLCYVVSNRYFEAPLPRTYRQILPSSACVAAGALGYFALLRLVWPAG
jgi:hypothetical protein